MERKPSVPFVVENLPDTARTLKEKFNNIFKPDKTPLEYALLEGNVPLVQSLLEHGADVSRVGCWRKTPLHCACSLRNPKVYELCELLVEKGADCNARDENTDQMTPLLTAFRFQPLKVIRLLLDHGADMTVRCNNGRTVLHYAVGNPNSDVLEFALDQGLDVDCGDAEGNSALHIAAVSDNLRVCELLLKRGAAVNRKNRKGEAPLEQLCFFLTLSSRGVSAVELLLEHGAEIHGKVSGRSILEHVSIRCDHNVKFVLIRHLTKLEYLNSTIGEADRRTIEHDDYYRTMYRACSQEIESMKETSFYNNVPIFSVLMHSDKVVSGYAKNEKLVEALGQKDYGNRFPIYFPGLKTRFYAEVKKHRLRNTAAGIICNLFRFNDPSHLVNQNILRYVGDAGVEWLCSHCDPDCV